MTDAPRPFGLVAEFDTADGLLAAARRVHAAGFRRFDAFSPVPVEGLAELVGERAHWLTPIAAAGGMLAAAGGLLLQYWISAIDYPLNVGGRPLASWPAFVPVTVILAILGASVAAFLGMLALNRLPALYHPVFDAPDFHRASEDRFFLLIRTDDPVFEEDAARRLLARQAPVRLSLVGEAAP